MVRVLPHKWLDIFKRVLIRLIPLGFRKHIILKFRRRLHAWFIRQIFVCRMEQCPKFILIWIILFRWKIFLKRVFIKPLFFDFSHFCQWSLFLFFFLVPDILFYLVNDQNYELLGSEYMHFILVKINLVFVSPFGINLVFIWNIYEGQLCRNGRLRCLIRLAFCVNIMNLFFFLGFRFCLLFLSLKYTLLDFWPHVIFLILRQIENNIVQASPLVRHRVNQVLKKPQRDNLRIRYFQKWESIILFVDQHFGFIFWMLDRKRFLDLVIGPQSSLIIFELMKVPVLVKVERHRFIRHFDNFLIVSHPSV